MPDRPDSDPLTAESADVLARVLKTLNRLAADLGVEFTGTVELPVVSWENVPGGGDDVNPTLYVEYDEVAGGHLARQLRVEGDTDG